MAAGDGSRAHEGTKTCVLRLMSIVLLYYCISSKYVKKFIRAYVSEINVKKYPEKFHSAATKPPNYPTMNFKKPLRLRKEINRNFLFGVATRLSPEGKKVFFDRKNEEKNPKKRDFL